MKKINLLVVLFVSTTMISFAQTSVSHKVRIIANPVLELQFDETHKNTDFTFNTVADYDNGKTNLEAAGLKVRSNKNWVVNVKASSATFTPLSTGDTDIQSNAFQVRKNGTETKIPVYTYDQTIASGNNGGFDKNNFVLDYIAQPGYIKPDSYSIEITYTLTTP